jgi:hypothetical protein
MMTVSMRFDGTASSRHPARLEGRWVEDQKVLFPEEITPKYSLGELLGSYYNKKTKRPEPCRSMLDLSKPKELYWAPLAILRNIGRIRVVPA